MVARPTPHDRLGLTRSRGEFAPSLAGTRWGRVEHRSIVTSTQDVAYALLAAGEPAELIVVADGQSAGRGRRGRTWTDRHTTGDGQPTNLAVSFAVEPHGSRRLAVPVALVPFAVGLALCAALRPSGLDAVLKWPNDVLVGGRKVAGVLVERHTITAPDDTSPPPHPDRDVLIIGCGVNLDWRNVDTDPAAPREWTSLAEFEVSVDRDDLLVGLARELDAALACDGATTLRRYRRACDTIGREVRVSLPGGGIRTGTAHDVDSMGRLGIEPGDHWLQAADVEHVRPAP